MKKKSTARRDRGIAHRHGRIHAQGPGQDLMHGPGLGPDLSRTSLRRLGGMGRDLCRPRWTRMWT